MPEPTPAAAAADPKVTAITPRDEPREQRVADITNMAEAHGFTAELPGWLRGSKSALEVSREISDKLARRLADPRAAAILSGAGGIPLPPKDRKRFSFARALIMADGELTRDAGRAMDFGFEREVTEEARKQTPFTANKGGRLIPFITLTDEERALEQEATEERMVARAMARMMGTRANVDSATTSTGGIFKFTMPGDFIGLLRNRTSVMRAGATVLSGLTGPVTFPKQLAAVTGTWVAENPGSDMSRSNLTTTSVSLAFKTIQGATAVSRQALFSAASGNYDLEGIIRTDLALVIALAIDLGGLAGTGANNQPTGILTDTSVGAATTLGTNGGTMAWTNWVNLETTVGDANADTTRMSYITNTKQRGVGKTTAVLGNTASGVPIWTGVAGDMDGQVNGYRAIASNQVPRNLTKGTASTVCSAVVFGAFEYLLIGMFGAGFEVLVDPYTLKLQNMIDITAWNFCDVANRYPVGFASLKDAL